MSDKPKLTKVSTLVNNNKRKTHAELIVKHMEDVSEDFANSVPEVLIIAGMSDEGFMFQVLSENDDPCKAIGLLEIMKKFMLENLYEDE